MRYVGPLYLVFLWLPLIPWQSWAQFDRSNRGTDFWLGYGHNILFTANDPTNTQNQVLYLSAEEATTVTVSIPGNGWSQTVTIPANSVDASIILPKAGLQDARIPGDGKWNRGIHVQSEKPIVAYTHQYGAQSSGATLLLPQTSFGFKYFSVNYAQVSNISNAHSWFYVVACENNTRIEITPSDTTHGGMLPGQTFTVDLNRGEVYNVFGKLENDPRFGKDLTGSKVISVPGADGHCHPIAFFSGSSRLLICQGDGGEFMQQQIFPSTVWGTRYLTYHTMTNLVTDLSTPFTNFYRVSVQNPNTVVRRNGMVLTGLVRNFYYEFSSDGGDLIEADQPVMVSQFTPSSNQCTGNTNPPAGDPEMIILSPLEQGIRSVRFYNSRLQAIDLSYIQLIVHTNGLPSLRINGTPVAGGTIAHPANPNYRVVARRLLGPAAQNTVTCDSAFTGIVYGLGAFESYAYNLGAMLNNLNSLPPAISNTLRSTNLPDTFTCIQAPFRFTIRLAYRATLIRLQLGTLPLLNAGDTTLFNPIPMDTGQVNGRTYYNYTIQRDYQFADTGRYILQVSASAPDIDFCNNEEVLQQVIVVKPAPVADFNISFTGCLSDTAYFTETSDPAGMNLDRFYWKVNNGQEMPARNFAAKMQRGNNVVYLKIISSNGCLHDTAKVVTPTSEVISAFSVDRTVICPGDPVQIADNSSVLGTGALVRWDYYPSQGTRVLRNDPSPFSLHFNDTGMVTIKLVARTDAQCLSDTFSANIRVEGMPTINAGPDMVLLAGYSTLIKATSASPAGTQYNWSPGTSLNDPTLLNPTTSATSDIQYTLQALNGPCRAADSMNVFVLENLKIPNSFSPNGDGINDTWVIRGMDVLPDPVMRVFDRYGQLVFASRGYQRAWDGLRNGRPVPAGTYYFILELNNGMPPLNGSLTVIR
ncbi:MAG TPA: gliding motility-associated C-terminal domain-containing protein [Phnomibacter sp.]|nr:gliding motility-associated C-terminal domain-containing protein [Phnomibacter sp.]